MDAPPDDQKDSVRRNHAQSSFHLLETEQQPGTSESCNTELIKPLKNWHAIFCEIVEGCGVDNDGKEWILSNFHQWGTLDDLEQSDEIVPKKIKVIKTAMSVQFSDFIVQRKLFLQQLESFGLNGENVNEAPIVFSFSRGTEALKSFVNSEQLREYFSEPDCDIIRNYLALSSQITHSDQKLQTNKILKQIEQILIAESLNPDAVAEVMQKVVDFEDLQTGLESCDELKRKEVKLLTEKLGDVFAKLKTAKQCKHPNVQMVLEFMEVQSFPIDGINWVLDWLPEEINELGTLNQLDNCDELSRKHCRIVKEKISEIYQLNEQHEAQNQIKKPAREIFLEKVDSILKSRLDIVANAQTWILENVCSFRRLDELERSEDLTKKQITYLKTTLKDAFEQFRLVECVPRDFESRLNCDNDDFFDLPSTSAEFTFSEQIDDDAQFEDALEMLEEEFSQLTIIPLILFNLEKQEGYAVEKFSLSESGVESICNLGSKRDGQVPIFYNSISHGIMIDFEALNNLRIECLGLFGPTDAVLQTVAGLIPAESVELFNDKFKSLATGLYLFDVNTVQQKFVIFRSQDGTEFDSVKKDSRAGHFLRYMSQLTKTVVFCIDGKYEDRLATEEKEVSKISRRSRYALKKHELQQEAIKLKLLGIMEKKPEMEQFDRLFSTPAGLIAIVSEETEGSAKPSFVGQMTTLYELEPMVMTSEILDLDKICEPFKMQFVQVFYPHEYTVIEEQADLETRMNSDLSQEYIEEVVMISTALFFIRTAIYRVSGIVEDYLKFNPYKTNNVWNNRINFDKYSIFKVFQEEDAYGIGTALKRVTEIRNSIQKYLIWVALDHRQSLPLWIQDKGFNQVSWEELYRSAKKIFSVPPWHPPGETEKNIRYAMAEVAKNLDLRNADEFLENSVTSFLEYACKLIAPFKETPSFVTFCRKHQNEVVNGYRSKVLRKLVVLKFDSIMNQRDLSSFQNAAKQIRHINVLDKMIDNKEYSLMYKTMKLEPSKKTVKFFELTPTRHEQQRLTLNFDSLNIKNVNFFKSGELEIPSHLALHSAFSVDPGKILVIFNEESRSDCSIFNYSNMKKPLCKMTFGKIVSESSFDSRNRVLLLHSCQDFGVINILRYSDDYKSVNKLRALELNKLLGIDNSFMFCVQPNSRFLWVLYEERLHKMDYIRCALSKAVRYNTELEPVHLICSPDGSCVLAVSTSGKCVPVMTETGNVLGELSDFASEEFDFDKLHLTSICNQKIAVYQNKDAEVSLVLVEITGAEHETKLDKTDVHAQQVNLVENLPGTHQSHWINYLYWMYTKFPCDDFLDPHEEPQHYWMYNVGNGHKRSSKIQAEVNSIYYKLQLTCKPLSKMKLHSENVFAESREIQNIATQTLQLGNFLKKLITFVPIQIARCQANSFHILDNGQPVSLDSVNITFDLISKINLGCYESIFNAWNGDIKVISSMGKQSTGKSYTLNHLTGSSFNIAGTRCTDGCWMTVKEQNDCLYVILDFEGLGSFERTEQEDMLLSLFNSSISTITIFKTEKRLDRDVDKMFNKINTGSDQLKGNGQVFKGKFMIIINDVAEADVVDTPKEFEEKISTIVTKSDNNFIKKLFNGDFEIMTFPAFESTEYYVNIANLLLIIKNELKPIFRSGAEFVRTLKLLMAKLAVNDFSPLDRQQINERVRFLVSHLDNAVKFGQISDELPKRQENDLKILDDPKGKILITKKINLAAVGKICLNDFEVNFVPNQMEDSVLHFLTICKMTPENFMLWRDGLVSYLSESIQFRFERVKIWLQLNLKKWGDLGNPEYDDVIRSTMERLETKELSFQQNFKFCDEKCKECFLKCTQILNHKNVHKCPTAHKCTALCEYCCSVGNKPCKLPYGHNGKHVCAEFDHLCGSPCRFEEINGCAAECQKMSGHTDEHECSEKRHPCKEVCSLMGCEGRCTVSCEEEHSVHKCTKEQCIKQCAVSACTNKCSALDHFHGFEFSQIYKREQMIPEEPPFLLEDGVSRFDCEEHFCGKEHQCERECTNDGFCHVVTEKQLKEEDVFRGARDTFTYSLKFVERGQKLTCRRKIERFAKTHEGGHVCSNEMHFCVTICPTCENICDKPVNHEKDGDTLHHARHGNMRKCYFVADETDIQVGSHKYKVGEPAVAEMCHMFCNSIGRGHVHVVECDSDARNCVHDAREDGRRHQTTKYYPNPDIPKDEMTHEAYWAMIGFEDPCQEIDVEEFQKCPAICAAETHAEDGDEPLCELELFHPSIKKPSDVGQFSGFVSRDGHLFPCDHPVRFYHFVLCLDDSGSMRGQPWDSLVSAVEKFVRQRLLMASNDKISIMNHHHKPWTAVEYASITEFSRYWVRFRGGGNDFSAALEVADDLIGSHLDKGVIPVLIFMSDGSCREERNGQVEMQEIYKKYKRDHQLEIYTLGFGRYRFEQLQDLARIGRGHFAAAVDNLQLNTAFVEISAKHPATIGVVV